jgi:hypothetical protein
MKIVVAILADIHLTDSASHPFSKRIDLIAAAIGSAEVMPDGIVIILGGDIADKGKPSEYAAMSSLISQLREKLSKRFPSVTQYFVSVPGNHDLHHPEDSEGYRKNLIDGSIPTLRDPQPNAVYLSRLLEPQNPYHTFAQSLDVPLTHVHSRICESINIPFGSKILRLNLINTALLSQRKERQAELYLPMPLLRRVIENDKSATLTITVLHHPLYWIESNTLLELREFLGATSDYVLTGHQHFSSGFEESVQLGPNLKYYESPAFYDKDKAPNASAFRVLVFDLNSDVEKQLLFRWSNDRYEPDASLETQSDWAKLVHNRALRPTITMNPSVAESFNNPGFAYIQQQQSGIGLLDLFVYPDLRLTEGLTVNSRQIKGKDVADFLSSPGITILQGGTLCGKTSLSKRLFLDARTRNDSIPVWIDGSSLNARTVDELESFIRDAFKIQYSKQQLNAYLQLLPSQRTIIIDNWHLAHTPLSLKPDIYAWLSKFCDSSVLLVDQVYQVKELLGASPETSSLATSVNDKLRKGVICGLGNVAKAALIHRWLRSRKTDDSSAPEESKESKKLEELVSALLGKDSLPVYAFYVLCILQALETQKTAALAGGSFGPLFEILIFSAIEKTQPGDIEISTKIVFMQEIAFYMWTNSVTSLSREKIDEIAASFEKRNLLKLPVSDYLTDLLEAKVLTSYDGNYSFPTLTLIVLNAFLVSFQTSSAVRPNVSGPSTAVC